MALKILSRGFLKPGDKKKKFDLITIRICGRPCSISFFPRESMAKFKRIQNDDPQIISGALLDIDCSNINIPSVRPKEPIYHSPHIPDGPNYAHYISSRSSREAYDRAMDRHRDRVTALEMGADDKYDRDMAKFKEALAKFEARVRNAEEKIEANKKEITDKFNEFTFYIYKNDLYYFNSPEVHSQNDQKLLIKKYHVGEQKKLDKFQKELEIIERLAKRAFDEWNAHDFDYEHNYLADGYNVFSGLEPDETIVVLAEEEGINLDDFDEDELWELQEEVAEEIREMILEEAEEQGYEAIWHPNQIAGDAEVGNGYWTFEKVEEETEKNDDEDENDKTENNEMKEPRIHYTQYGAQMGWSDNFFDEFD